MVKLKVKGVVKCKCENGQNNMQGVVGVYYKESVVRSLLSMSTHQFTVPLGATCQQ